MPEIWFTGFNSPERGFIYVLRLERGFIGVLRPERESTGQIGYPEPKKQSIRNH